MQVHVTGCPLSFIKLSEQEEYVLFLDKYILNPFDSRPICLDLYLASHPLPFIYVIVGLVAPFQGYYHLLPFASLTVLPKPSPTPLRALVREQGSSSPKG